jgi:hypothetical protein
VKLYPPTPFHLALLVLNVAGAYVETLRSKPVDWFTWCVIAAMLFLCALDIVGFRRKEPP